MQPKTFVTTVLSLALAAGACGLVPPPAAAAMPDAKSTFVIVADPHYGNYPDLRQYNLDCITALNALPAAQLPGGRGAVGPVSFVGVLGDVANRMETTNYLRADVSWSQYTSDYGTNGSDGLLQYPVYTIAGNHDHSNAHTDPRVVEHHAAVLDGIAARHGGLYYSLNLAGVHLVFADIWPDAEVRAWMAADLAAVGASAPVLVFMHDTPDSASTVQGHLDSGAVSDNNIAALKALLDGYNVRGIFYGHTHTYAHRLWDDMDLFNAPSVSKSGNSSAALVVTLDQGVMTVDQYLWQTGAWGDSVSVNLPEPVSAVLLTAGGLLLLGTRRRRLAA